MNTRLIAISASLLLNVGFLSAFHLSPHWDVAQAEPAPRSALAAPASLPIHTLATIVVTPTAAERAAALNAQ